MGDAARDSGPMLLRARAREEELDQLMARLRALLEMNGPVEPARRELAATAAMARQVARMQRERHARQKFLSPSAASEPAWPILLEMLAAALAGEAASVKRLTYASAVPPTTALRWINVLVEEGYAVRHRGEQDARLTLLSLSQKGQGALQDYFRYLEEHLPA